MKPHKNKKNDPFICRCNGIPKSKIEQAIREGCESADKVGDATSAGRGGCGGTCRPILKEMVATYLSSGEFPPHPEKFWKSKKRKKRG